MELFQVKNCIEKLIAEIGKYRRQIEERGNARAQAISNYDMRMQIAIVTLREEGKFPITLIEKIAKGLCCKDRETMELAESNYRACISNLNALLAQLNGYQSIFRHFSEA